MMPAIKTSTFTMSYNTTEYKMLQLFPPLDLRSAEKFSLPV